MFVYIITGTRRCVKTDKKPPILSLYRAFSCARAPDNIPSMP